MFTDSVVLSLYFETPLHTPSSGVVGPVEYPVQRERTTNWPVIHASTLEEALKQALSSTEEGKGSVEKLFGKGGFDNSDRALSVGDAKILLFPVRSSAAPFLWVTSPAVIGRFRRDMNRLLGLEIPAEPKVKSGEILVTDSWDHGEQALVLEDVVLTPRKGYDPGALLQLLPNDSPAYAEFDKDVKASLGLVPDEVFAFLVKSATEVRPRGGVFADMNNPSFIEAIPGDSVFYATIEGRRIDDEPAVKVLGKALRPHINVGEGKHIGWGWARTRFVEAAGGEG